MPQYLRTIDVCRMLGVSRDTVLRWASRGILKPARIGGVVLYDPDELRQLVQSRKAAHA